MKGSAGLWAHLFSTILPVALVDTLILLAGVGCLAALIGTTLHNVSRILTGWERDGLVEGGRRTLLVRDIEALMRRATGDAPDPAR